MFDNSKSGIQTFARLAKAFQKVVGFNRMTNQGKGATQLSIITLITKDFIKQKKLAKTNQ